MAKKKSLVQKITSWKIVLCIQILASLLLVGFVFKLGILPWKYAIVLIVLLALLCVLNFFLMKKSKTKGKGKVRNIIGKVLSILLSVVLLVGTLYVAQSDSTIASITGADSQTTRISVMVLKDSKYSQLSDLKGKTLAYNGNVDLSEQDGMDKALDALKDEESSVKLNEYSDYIKMAKDLYDGKVDAVYMNEAYYGIIENDYENFETETKVIYSYEYEEEIKDITKAVDVVKDPFVIFISGIDTRGKVSTVSRSDVNMIVTVNPKTKQILMTSIPRDYYVTLANKGKKDKLTHAGLAGTENSVKTVENLMGIDINYYARVNFTSLIKMVDALGGITVDIPKSFTSGVDGSQFYKGKQVLNGEKALKFARERKAFGGGDNARIHNQQVVLTAMLKKAMSPAIITNYSRVLKSIDGSFETNMKSDDIMKLIQMQIDDMASWTFVQKQLTGKGTQMTGGAYMPGTKLYYMIPNQDSVNENQLLIKKVLKGETVE